MLFLVAESFGPRNCVVSVKVHFSTKTGTNLLLFVLFVKIAWYYRDWCKNISEGTRLYWENQLFYQKCGVRNMRSVRNLYVFLLFSAHFLISSAFLSLSFEPRRRSFIARSLWACLSSCLRSLSFSLPYHACPNPASLSLSACSLFLPLSISLQVPQPCPPVKNVGSGKRVGSGNGFASF